MRRMTSTLRMILIVTLALVMVMGLGGCAKKESLVGKWQSNTNFKVIEFKADGTYNSVTQKDYKYTLMDDNQVKIYNPGDKTGKDALVIKYTVKDKVLTTEFEGYKATFKSLEK